MLGSRACVLLWLQSSIDTASMTMHLAVPEVEEGCLLQLHVRDGHWSEKGMRKLIQVGT